MSRWVTRRSILVSWKKEGTISNPFIYGLFQEKMVKKLRKNSIKKGFLHRVVHLLSFPVVPRAFLKCHTRKKSLDFLKNTKLFSTRWHLTLFKIVSKSLILLPLRMIPTIHSTDWQVFHFWPLLKNLQWNWYCCSSWANHRNYYDAKLPMRGHWAGPHPRWGRGPKYFGFGQMELTDGHRQKCWRRD